MSMGKTCNAIWLFLCCVLIAPAHSAQGLLLDITGAIGPATADYVRTGFADARAQNATLIVLRLDTPGGLDSAMRDIVKEILASPIPVVGYVAPSGARAASAGTYILQACHVAAMAPATTLGSATPVTLGGLPELPHKPDRQTPADKAPVGKDDSGDQPPNADTASTPGSAMERKMVNDAASYLRGLAALRGRNVDWAEQAVRSAANLPASEALKEGVIDLIADNVPDLLARLDGRTVQVLGVKTTMRTADTTVETYAADWRTQLLSILTNPNIAYVLLMVGIYGLIFELANPGTLLPGVTGAIALVLALYAFQALPVSFAGLALLVLGIAFMTLEAFLPSFGALGIGGVIAFAAGSIMLFRDDAGQISVALPVIATFVVLSLVLFVGIVGYAVKTRRRPVTTGAEEMVGAIGEALEDFQGHGRIRVHGESWGAHSERPVRRGQSVRVTAIDGLVLKIEEVEHD